MRRCVELASAAGPIGPESAFRHRSSAINTAIRRSVRAGIAVTTGALLLAAGATACGTVKELSAGEKLSGAFEKLGDAKSLSFQLSVDATPDQIVAFGKAVDDPIEQKDADLFADLTLNVSMSADKPLKDTEAFKSRNIGALNDPYDLKGVAVGYALAAKKSGQTYADVRIVGDKLYLKADVRGLARMGGQDTGEIDQLMAQLPPEAAPVKDVVDGKWVSMDLKKLREASEKEKGSGSPLGGNPLTGSPLGAMPSFDPAEMQRFGDTVKAVVSKNITVEEKGKSGDADVIQVSAPARPLVEGLMKAVEKLASGSSAFPPIPSDDMPEVPDRKFAADVLIKGGKAQAVTFDLMQFADKPDAAAHFPLRLGFVSDAPAVTAPAGATEFDLSKLQEAAAKLAAAGGSEGGADGPAAPLTEAQYAELAAVGVTREEARTLNSAGLSFQDIKEFGTSVKG
ncbi:hypothetical protein [Kitasatospora cheerisanensis]|uniref:Uncharacterized protein n=1 Tax=Kitasatospora cheerisanensis KCTC 2395 TaxID=1348663 RepID=A0A066YZ93_9ACTN|nr:hypothetical protein [Kitasatospora cheerisanensis]KDN83215.1 hypothetical protein KCH_46970 [Kitasatospora cheerisanensis KCTC 2395]